ncbi:hypothetical protein Tco_0740075 [Tanacetum coccineum]
MTHLGLRTLIKTPIVYSLQARARERPCHLPIELQYKSIIGTVNMQILDLTLHMDFDFIPSHNDLGSDLDVSSPSGDKNKIYDPGICIEDCPDFEASRARGFVLRSLELQPLA